MKNGILKLLCSALVLSVALPSMMRIKQDVHGMIDSVATADPMAQEIQDLLSALKGCQKVWDEAVQDYGFNGISEFQEALAQESEMTVDDILGESNDPTRGVGTKLGEGNVKSALKNLNEKMSQNNRETLLRVYKNFLEKYYELNNLNIEKMEPYDQGSVVTKNGKKLMEQWEQIGENVQFSAEQQYLGLSIIAHCIERLDLGCCGCVLAVYILNDSLIKVFTLFEKFGSGLIVQKPVFNQFAYVLSDINSKNRSWLFAHQIPIAARTETIAENVNAQTVALEMANGSNEEHTDTGAAQHQLTEGEQRALEAIQSAANAEFEKASLASANEPNLSINEVILLWHALQDAGAEADKVRELRRLRDNYKGDLNVFQIDANIVKTVLNGFISDGKIDVNTKDHLERVFNEAISMLNSKNNWFKSEARKRVVDLVAEVLSDIRNLEVAEAKIGARIKNTIGDTQISRDTLRELNTRINDQINGDSNAWVKAQLKALMNALTGIESEPGQFIEFSEVEELLTKYKKSIQPILGDILSIISVDRGDRIQELQAKLKVDEGDRSQTVTTVGSSDPNILSQATVDGIVNIIGKSDAYSSFGGLNVRHVNWWIDSKDISVNNAVNLLGACVKKLKNENRNDLIKLLQESGAAGNNLLKGLGLAQ